jgi:hypothetical protein
MQSQRSSANYIDEFYKMKPNQNKREDYMLLNRRQFGVTAKARFYAEWKEKYGPDAWRSFEKYSGSLS